jgi:hypothetical protein
MIGIPRLEIIIENLAVGKHARLHKSESESCLSNLVKNALLMKDVPTKNRSAVISSQ